MWGNSAASRRSALSECFSSYYYCERSVFISRTVILFYVCFWGAPEFQGAYHELSFEFLFFSLSGLFK